MWWFNKNKRKKNSEEHKQFLIDLYENTLSSMTTEGFYKSIYQQALRYVNAGVKPTDVEKWFHKIIHLYEKSPRIKRSVKPTGL